MPSVKKILLISYYWPPASGMAVQRWLRMSNELADLGVEVHVLTLEPSASYSPTSDLELLKQVRPRVRVKRIDSLNLFVFVKKLLGSKMPKTGFASDGKNNLLLRGLTSLRSHLFIPDPRKTWNRRALSAAKKMIDDEGIQWVVTTSPPHSVHLIGLALQKHRGIRWIADFRDPWTDIFYYKQLRHSKLSRFFDRRMERSVLDAADAVVSVTPGLSRLLSEKVEPSKRDKFAVITNGYDRNELEPSAGERGANFQFVYTGTVIESYEVEPFFESLERIIHRFPGIKMDIAGSISNPYRLELESRFPFLCFHGVMAYDTVIQKQESADALLLFGPSGVENKGHIPGKLFEYLRTGKPIIYLGEKGSDVSNILTSCSAGQTFQRMGDEDAMDAFNAELIEQAEGRGSHNPNWDEIRKYRRKGLAEKFLQMMERMDQR